MKVVLFLCTGNYYRSRFAEETFNFLAPVECPGWTAVSRGIALDLGINNVGPIAGSTAQALQKAQGLIRRLRGCRCSWRLPTLNRLIISVR
jgi:protein-tyrosine-phosphatase